MTVSSIDNSTIAALTEYTQKAPVACAEKVKEVATTIRDGGWYSRPSQDKLDIEA